MAAMARVIALAHAPLRGFSEETVRSAIVCSCALALIMAKTALPF